MTPISIRQLATSFGLAIYFVTMTMGWSAPAEASEPYKAVGAIEDGDPRVEAELVLDAARAAPGDDVRAGVVLRIDPEWHVYWRNSGESGMSTEFTVDAGLANVGPTRWPAPEVFVDKSGQIATFGYAEEVLFHRTGRVPADANGTHEVVTTIDYLACKVDCIPGRHELRRTLEIGDWQGSDFPEDLADREPVAPESLGLATEVALSRTDLRPGEEIEATIGLRCESDDCETARVEEAVPLRYTLIPDVTAGIDWKTTDVEEMELGTRLKVVGRASRDDFEDSCELAGVIWVATEPVPTPVEIRREIPCSNDERAAARPTGIDLDSSSTFEPETPPGGEGEESLIYILFLALVGGMILNLMPCVFPVLAVKVFSFVKLAHENRSSVFRHSGAYTAGIVTTMMGLAAAVIGLKAAGSEVGWGFQFQEPLFIVFLASALVLFALNLFGAFEVSLGTGGLESVREAEFGLKRSFGEGVLAVVLATPCSAPFLGTAVGFAFSADAATIVAVFFALGIGLALPFAVLTAVPSWAKLLPRPGAWMITFKQLLAFALLGTVVWLVWILGQSVGSGAIASLLAFLVVLSLAAWAWGKVQFGSPVKKWVVGMISIALVATTGRFTLDMDATADSTEVERSASASSASTEGPSGWPAYDEKLVRERVEAGSIVFVDFTADWCITCKVNERGVLSSDETAELFGEHDVEAYVADWTRKDDKIRKILARHGKAGVPMYLLFSPGNPDDPEVLPELLTAGKLRTSVERAAGSD